MADLGSRTRSGRTQLAATLTGPSTCFAAAGRPWQRGTNENVNGLLRQYLPKRTNFAACSQVKLNKIVDRLNSRPQSARMARTCPSKCSGH